VPLPRAEQKIFWSRSCRYDGQYQIELEFVMPALLRVAIAPVATGVGATLCRASLPLSWIAVLGIEIDLCTFEFLAFCSILFFPFSILDIRVRVASVQTNRNAFFVFCPW